MRYLKSRTRRQPDQNQQISFREAVSGVKMFLSFMGRGQGFARRDPVHTNRSAKLLDCAGKAQRRRRFGSSPDGPGKSASSGPRPKNPKRRGASFSGAVENT